MRILLAHLVYAPGVDRRYQRIAQAAPAGLEVQTFGVTLDPPGPRLTWLQLHHMWRTRHPKLMRMYQRLREAAQSCDVLLVYNGANVHPEFLRYLPTFNVYCCFDDPEASAGLSRPVAPAFDAVFYGNLASRYQYEAWGCSKLAHLPIFVSPDEAPPRDQEPMLFAQRRSVDIVLCGERNAWRRDRLDALVRAFPQAACYGDGWPNGRIDDAGLDRLYRQARIGWNVHNSTGPINQRLLALAGYGVMQIADNKTGLGQLFELGREAVGFDTIPEAIDATRYYLAHEHERQQIARRGYERFWRDYHPTRIWQRIRDQLEAWGAAKRSADSDRLPRRTMRDRVKAGMVRVQMGLALAQQKRRGRPQPPDKPLDERVYLGMKIDAVVHDELPEDDHSQAAHRARINRGALAWAVATLIGPAQQIGVAQPYDAHFAQLALVDRSRQLVTIDGPQPASCDLAVCLEVHRDADALERSIRACLDASPRAVLLADMPLGDWVARLRRQWSQVCLYHLPDPDVPWLEPVGSRPIGSALIVEVMRSAMVNRLAG
ncbi:MAG TPA: glycosyltransferase [Phycisphaeraceae bacterium]